MDDQHLDDNHVQELADKIEKTLIKKYKRIFIGTIIGFSVAFSVVAYF